MAVLSCHRTLNKSDVLDLSLCCLLRNLQAKNHQKEEKVDRYIFRRTFHLYLEDEQKIGDRDPRAEIKKKKKKNTYFQPKKEILEVKKKTLNKINKSIFFGV